MKGERVQSSTCTVSTFPQVFRAEFIGVFDQHLCHPCRGTDVYQRLQSSLNTSLVSQRLGDKQEIDLHYKRKRRCDKWGTETKNVPQ